uniref:Uncharacterized protein n=1 Tax=Knipowitschia caucasica TaxID=637954 RepID=A0AAV2IUL5_KNICA
MQKSQPGAEKTKLLLPPPIPTSCHPSLCSPLQTQMPSREEESKETQGERRRKAMGRKRGMSAKGRAQERAVSGEGAQLMMKQERMGGVRYAVLSAA